jgi:hypothetical protein
MTFGLFSCHMPYRKNSFDLVNIHMWDRFGDELDQRSGEFILGVGDQVYVDGNPNVSIWEWFRGSARDNHQAGATGVDLMQLVTQRKKQDKP